MMMAEATMDRYDIFTGLILSISRCIQKIKNEEMAAYGLKGKQVQCLFALQCAENGASLKQLCARCEEDKGAMSRTVAELTKSGLVYQETGTQKYRNPIKLTEKGRAFGKVVADRIAEVLDAASAGISNEEREIFYRTLGCISENLSAICRTYGGNK